MKERSFGIENCCCRNKDFMANDRRDFDRFSGILMSSELNPGGVPKTTPKGRSARNGRFGVEIHVLLIKNY